MKIPQSWHHKVCFIPTSNEWLLKYGFLKGGNDITLGHSEGFDADVELTYTAEHDFIHLRHVCVGMSDEEIVLMIASTATQWLKRLGGLMDC